MKITNYTGAVMDNDNGKSYRVIEIFFLRYHWKFIFTKIHGTGDDNTKTL